MGREFFICEDAAFVTPACPRLVSGNAVLPTSSASQGSDVLIRFYHVHTNMDRNSVCPRQVSNFCGLDKSTIPPVYLQLSKTLYDPPELLFTTLFSIVHQYQTPPLGG